MRKPRPANTPVDARRFRGWINEFAGYRRSVTEVRIQDWIEQFDPQDRDLAARVLDAVDFFPMERIAAAFRGALQSLTSVGWHANPAKRSGRWLFAPYSGTTGTSGDSMLHQFRIANDLDGDSGDDLFIHRSEIPAKRLGAEDSIVLLDDMTGSGSQVCDTWDQSFGELVVGIGRVFLIVVVAGKGAKKEIKQRTKLRLIPAHQLDSRDCLFHQDCMYFSGAEKDRLLHYGRIADKDNPKGFGECGFLIVFQHRCPNNSVPILHEDHGRWLGVFPRH